MHSGQIETRFFIGLLLCALVLVILTFLPVLNAMVLAVTFAVLFHPVYSKLRSFVPKQEWLAAIVTVVFAIILVLIPLTFFGITIFGEAQGLYAHIVSGNDTPFIESLNSQLQKIVPWLNLDLNQYTKQILGLLMDNFGLIISRLITIVGTFLLSFLTLFYFLKDGAAIERTIVRISPLSHERINAILSKLRSMVDSVLKGTLVIAIIEGIAVGFGFFIFGLPNPALWGLVSTIAALVPIVGIALVVVPAVITLLFQGSLISMLGFAVWILVVIGVMENFLRPRIITHNTKVHPLLILLSVLSGIAFFGVMGFLLGPLVLSLFLALLEIYPEIILDRKPVL